jgi:NADP-dependent 3-hydroxy acid dehydrogenase YdfG
MHGRRSSNAAAAPLPNRRVFSGVCSFVSAITLQHTLDLAKESIRIGTIAHPMVEG